MTENERIAKSIVGDCICTLSMEPCMMVNGRTEKCTAQAYTKRMVDAHMMRSGRVAKRMTGACTTLLMESPMNNGKMTMCMVGVR